MDEVKIPKELKFYKISCNVKDKAFAERGVVATNINYDTIFSRLNNSELIEKFSLEEINKEDVEFPITLIGVNSKYNSWEDLVKDYMVAKISGIIG